MENYYNERKIPLIKPENKAKIDKKEDFEKMNFDVDLKNFNEEKNYFNNKNNIQKEISHNNNNYQKELNELMKYFEIERNIYENTIKLLKNDINQLIKEKETSEITAQVY